MGSRLQTVELTSSAAASPDPAKTLATMDTGPELRDTEADYGQNTIGSFAHYDPDTCSWKTWQHSLFGGLIEFCQTWPQAGTMQSGQLFPHAQWVRHTCDRECSLLPTPQAADHKGACKPSKTTKERMANGMANLPETCQELGIVGAMSPLIPEWLNGLPIGWTELEQSETPSSLKSQNGSDSKL